MWKKKNLNFVLLFAIEMVVFSVFLVEKRQYTKIMTISIQKHSVFLKLHGLGGNKNYLLTLICINNVNLCKLLQSYQEPICMRKNFRPLQGC